MAGRCDMKDDSVLRQAILAAEFGRQPLIIPNGIDCHRFTPGPRAQITPTATMVCRAEAQVLSPNRQTHIGWRLQRLEYV